MAIRKLTWCLALAAGLAARDGFGHGAPIRVDVLDGRLVVGGGLLLENGFAPQAFDPHEDSFLDTAPGNTLGSILPGFEINGMDIDSELGIEILPRPDFTRDGDSPRWLWFWSETTGKVGVASANPVMELASQRLFGSIVLPQFDEPTTPASMKVAEPLAEDLGTHQHPILYLLDNDPPVPSGVYGFFARLTSPNYETSDRFLIALNRTDPANFAEGASHINAAARLPGDFDGDDDVDGADLLVWQRTVGSSGGPGDYSAADATLDGAVDAADLASWRDSFGEVVVFPPAIASGATVPEPDGMAICAVCSGLMAASCRRRRSG